MIQNIQFSHKDHTISRTRPIDPVVQVVDSKTVRAIQAPSTVVRIGFGSAMLLAETAYIHSFGIHQSRSKSKTIRKTINMQTKCVYKLTMPIQKWKATGMIDSL